MFWILIQDYLKHELNKNYLNSRMERTLKKAKYFNFFLLEEHDISKDLMTKKEIVHFLVPMHHKDQKT